MKAEQRKYIASIFLTSRCDLACQFCGSESTFPEVSFAQASELLNTLKLQGFTQIVLGGGEPLLWPHTFELAKIAKQMGFLVQLCSNGVKLDRLSELPVHIDRFLLPIESLHREKHNSLRSGSPGGFNDHYTVLLSLIEKMRESRKEVTFSTVVTSINHAELLVMANWMRELSRIGTRIHAWHLYKFLPVGRGGVRSQHDLNIDKRTYREAISQVQNRQYDFAIFRRSDMYRSRSVAYFGSDGSTISALTPPLDDQSRTSP